MKIKALNVEGKAMRGKYQAKYKSRLIRTTSDFTMETLKAKMT